MALYKATGDETPYSKDKKYVEYDNVLNNPQLFQDIKRTIVAHSITKVDSEDTALIIVDIVRCAFEAEDRSQILAYRCARCGGAKNDPKMLELKYPHETHGGNAPIYSRPCAAAFHNEGIS